VTDLNLEEFNVKVDALFLQAIKGELRARALSLKHELRRLCIQFENDLIKQGLSLEIEEIGSESVVFLCDD